MKPRRICNAAENELATPKSAFVPTISQCGGSTKSLKPHELTKPKKTSFQRVNQLLHRQTHRTNFQQEMSFRLYKPLLKQRISELSFAQKLKLKNDITKQRLTNYNLEIHFQTLALIALNLLIWLRLSSWQLTPH
ncbi:TPA: hypothetical protein ACY4P9_004699 [Vibrio parahaemolyticus]|nr:hypothetical protein [Vibrio parahaemolyticus]MBE4453821.1 hypothetical protein [Vibrio parahaemolyticus]HCG7315141.1 hypothetical protein [Vibrio parahaemolyticus]HCG7383768.1 hypothetical protein [Vibrio parahaemolyticus]